MERTLVLIKPDGIKRRLSGEIISRFERKGLKILGMKMLKLDRKRAEAHYAVHRDKPFFNDLVNYISSRHKGRNTWMNLTSDSTSL